MATLDEKNSRPSHIESAEDDVSQTKGIHPDLKLDAQGLPLVPQPSDQQDDPLVCRQNVLSPG